MKKSFARITLAAVVAFSGTLLAADAPTLDDLRKEGVVGERFDGTVAVRTESAGKDVRKLVESVNAQRRAIYEERAAEQGVPADQVGRVYAEEILGKASEGTWFLDAEGIWIRKGMNP